MRSVLHFAPVSGWFNDPNGLIDHRGTHHLFFQHNPDALTMEHMCWGHASSTDLLTWTEHPPALRPGPPGSADDDGCWSGCAVHDGDAVVAVYSGHHDGQELPCVARPLDDDLIGWHKSPANPVVDRRPPVAGLTDMRDHSVRREGGRWRQVLAGGVDGSGALFGYTSTDLGEWKWDGIVLEASDADLPGRVWECPDVFRVGDEVVAIVSLIDDDRSPVLWITGTTDEARIIPRRWGLVDHGDRLYAPQSYTDRAGRRIMFGWLRTHLDPAALGQPSLGVASLPRVLSVVDGRLHQTPAAEIESFRGEPQVSRPDEGGTEVSMELDGEAVEVHITCHSTDLLLETRLDFDDGTGRHLGADLACFVRDDGLPADGGRDRHGQGPTRATVIFDCGIVEVFLDDGRAATTTDAAVGRVSRLRVWTKTAGIEEVTAWVLRPPDGGSAPATGHSSRQELSVTG